MSSSEQQPEWFAIGDPLIWPLIGMGVAAARDNPLPTINLTPIPELAVCHYAGCLEASIEINKRGKHSAAICLIRQAVEALTIAEIGFQAPDFAEPLLAGWNRGKKSQGELRRALEKKIWPGYGKGLWEESWAEFYSNLARAVQPYAHYTSELQGWQLAVLDSNGTTEATVTYGLETYDPLQASRVTLFHMLLTWMFGRILLHHGKSIDVAGHRERILRLGQALAKSNLLFESGEWWSQLAPHMLFKPGAN